MQWFGVAPEQTGEFEVVTVPLPGWVKLKASASPSASPPERVMVVGMSSSAVAVRLAAVGG